MYDYVLQPQDKKSPFAGNSPVDEIKAWFL
jgi:hypothetical protein